MSSSSSSSSSGKDKMDKYTVLRELGRGSFGIVNL